jgi:hypothetical protein
MATRRTRFYGSAVLLGLAAAVLALQATAIGQENAPESPREHVQRLLPGLQSQDDAVRERAETELFRLGDAGRREVERLSRDADPRKAVTALRLLQSDRWSDSVLRGGEQRVGPARDEVLDALDSRFSRLREELRGWLRRTVPDRLELPEFPELPDADELERAWKELSRPGFRSNGTVVEDGTRMEWTLDSEGRVTVTIREGDAEERRYRAESLDALRKAHPEIADKLSKYLRLPSRWPRVDMPELRRFRFPDRWRSLEFPELRELPEWPRLDPAADRPLLGIEWAPPSDALRSQLRLPEGGVLVQLVTPGSLAESLGIKRHDVLLELGGRVTKSGAQVREAVAALPETGEVRATVIRAGSRRVLTVTR